MKLLLDEMLPVELRHLIVGHVVFSVAYMRWNGIRNGKLLAMAAADGFDAIVTNDSGIPNQQNLKSLPIAIVVLVAESNDIGDLRPLVGDLLQKLNHLPPRAVTYVP